MSPKVFVLFALVASAVSFPQNGYGARAAPAPQNIYGAPAAPAAPVVVPKYNFDWSVNDQESGNNYGHNEERDGDNTQGSYFIVLADGRIERVTYFVNGDSGYVATVEIEEAPIAAAAPPPAAPIRSSYGYQ